MRHFRQRESAITWLMASAPGATKCIAILLMNLRNLFISTFSARQAFGADFYQAVRCSRVASAQAQGKTVKRLTLTRLSFAENGCGQGKNPCPPRLLDKLKL